MLKYLQKMLKEHIFWKCSCLHIDRLNIYSMFTWNWRHVNEWYSKFYAFHDASHTMKKSRGNQKMYIVSKYRHVSWMFSLWDPFNSLRPSDVYICVSKLTIIGSDNGLSPGRRQAIIWTNAGILLIRTLWTNFSEILCEINSFSFSKMHLKMSSATWRLFGLGLNELNMP